MEELKKCPFCGGEAYFRINHQVERKIKFMIECKNCRVSIPKIYEVELTLNKNGEIETPKDERGLAISDWNNRV